MYKTLHWHCALVFFYSVRYSLGWSVTSRRRPSAAGCLSTARPSSNGCSPLEQSPASLSGSWLKARRCCCSCRTIHSGPSPIPFYTRSACTGGKKISCNLTQCTVTLDVNFSKLVGFSGIALNLVLILPPTHLWCATGINFRPTTACENYSMSIQKFYADASQELVSITPGDNGISCASH